MPKNNSIEFIGGWTGTPLFEAFDTMDEYHQWEKNRATVRSAIAITHIFDYDTRQGHGFKEVDFDK